MLLAGTANATAFFEFGTATISTTTDNGGWVPITYQKTYVNPIVIVSPVSHNNERTLTPRASNVTAAGFDVGMQPPLMWS